MSAPCIKNVAVLGLGTMGHGIAQTFASAGCTVTCYDESAAARDGLLERIRGNLQQMTEAGLADTQSADRTLARITVSNTEQEAVAPARFVVEAVREDLAVKQALFPRVEAVVAPQTILASNTSSLTMTQIAAGMKRPERAVITHWFNPPHIVPVVEVVSGQHKTDQTVATAVAFLQQIGKTPIRLNQEIPGFVVNRVQIAMYREIWDLVERGVASPEDIDRAIQGSIGLRLAAIGPLQVNDFAGLDVIGRVFENLVTDIRSDTQLPSRIRKLIDEGHFGVKTGKGIFDYTPQSIEEKRSERDRRFLALVKLLHD